MKYANLLISTLILLLGTSLVQAATPNILVSDFNISSGIVSVGESFNLSVTLIDTEPTACAENIITSIQVDPPFIMDGLSTVSAGGLCNPNKKVVTFPLKVDPTATGGTYQLTINNNYQSIAQAQYSNSDTINLYITGSPKINAQIINSDPIDIYPGDTGTVTVSIQNDGTFQAQSVTAKLTAQHPLNVKWSKSTASFSTLDAKQTRTADFAVEVPKDAQSKDYNMNLAVTYLDENLNPQQADFPLTFHVKENAIFSVTTLPNQRLYQNDNSKVVHFNVENTGTETAHRITAKVLPQYPISTDGSVRYIDELAPGQTADIQFSINVDKDGMPGSYGLDILFNYEDPQGKRLQDTAITTFTVQQKNLYQAVFLDYQMGWVLAGVIVLLIIVREIVTKVRKKIKDPTPEPSDTKARDKTKKNSKK